MGRGPTRLGSGRSIGATQYLVASLHTATGGGNDSTHQSTLMVAGEWIAFQGPRPGVLCRSILVLVGAVAIVCGGPRTRRTIDIIKTVVDRDTMAAAADKKKENGVFPKESDL